ncbi:MAG TPA: hypothetical protein PLC99_06240 [Verrucomicrobiota bacterium]|nr:hypothetical protein [Verrucomicrobiota bacterium]
MRNLISVLVLFLGFTAFGATYCVGPSPTGSGSGADWNNLKAWSSTPVRGDTWYLVGGTYAAKTLGTAASGSTLITIKKATASNYTDVSATGWSSSYATPASIGGLTIGSSYWLIDGVTGDGARVVPADTNTSHYGFYIPGSHPVQLTGSASFITIAHCRFFTSPACTTGIYQVDVNQATKNDLTIQYCLFDGFSEIIRNGVNTWNNTVLEYSIILRSFGDSGCHGNVINAMWAPLVNMTIRYNVFKDMVGNGISGVISGNGSGLGPILCYGNVFDNIPHCTYVIGANGGYSINNSTFYNNTVIHCDNDDAGFAICGRTSGSGNVGGNNLLYDCISVLYNSAWSGDYDAFFSCSRSSGTHKYTATGDPFVNRAGMDYRLKANTPAGTSLASPYNVDALGNARTTWTRGAFEYGSASTNAVISVSPSARNFGSLALGTSSNLTFTIQNVGGGALSGTATVSAPFSILSGGTYSLGANQSQTVTVRYAPSVAGAYSANVTFTGGGGAVALVSGVAYAVLPGTSFAADAGVVSSPFVSSGGVISQSVDSGVSDGGRALYAFSLTNAGNYLVQAVVNAPSDAANSFYVNIDAEPTDPYMSWHIPVTSGFQTSYVSWQGDGTWDAPQFINKVFSLTVGTHQLIIRGREKNTQLQRISIVKDVGPMPPSNLRLVTSQ